MCSSTLKEILESLQQLRPDLLVSVNAALQNVSTIKPRKKRALVKGEKTRGGILKEIERNIANLDQWTRGAPLRRLTGRSALEV